MKKEIQLNLLVTNDFFKRAKQNFMLYLDVQLFECTNISLMKKHNTEGYFDKMID